MSQHSYIKDIAKYGLENDQERLLDTLNDLIKHSKKTKKLNFAIQLQSILKEAIHHQKTNVLTKVGSEIHSSRVAERELGDLILEKLTSDYTFDNLIGSQEIKEQLQFLVKEHQASDMLNSYDLPVSNKVLLHGPSGCGKTLASYVIAGELNKMMIVVNLGAIVSSKLGETSKNLTKIFRRAAVEDCIIFIDEFDTLGKVRDYGQDHGEMKRVVNTILQLFDYLPQSSMIIAATNQREMVDEALMRRFDLSVEFPLPDKEKIKSLIDVTLKNGKFKFDKPKSVNKIIEESVGLSYYSIQKSLITAIKRTLFEIADSKVRSIQPKVKVDIWKRLIDQEKRSILK
ncbi:AAA family ATPase [Ekhidna sp.]